MAIVIPESFENTKSTAIKALSDAYKACTDLIFFNDSEELEEACDAIITIRSTIRGIEENEQE